MSKKEKKTLAQIEKETIETALIEHSYNIDEVVKRLNITRYFLYKKISEYGILITKPEDVIN